MGQDIISDLLQYIHKYYPIGMPHLYDRPRDLERDRIVATKISEIIDGVKTPWTSLTMDLIENGLNISNMSHRQFPSYYLKIEKRPQRAIEHISYSRNLILIVSLLCPYYTAFYEDEYRFNNIRTEIIDGGPTFRIFFRELLPELSFDDPGSFTILKNLTEKHFQKHTFISHGILFGHHITGGVVELEALAGVGPFPVFSYLFEDSIQLKNLEIRP